MDGSPNLRVLENLGMRRIQNNYGVMQFEKFRNLEIGEMKSTELQHPNNKF